MRAFAPSGTKSRNSGKSGKVSPKIHRTEFPGISGNFFRGFPGISGNPWEFFRKFGGFSQNTHYGAVYSSVTCDENRGNSGKFSPKPCRTEFPGISGNFFRGFPGISEILGNFSGNSGVFPERALWSRVHAGKTG
jgi:hypothetical protein